MSRIPILSWVDFRATHYKFQAEKEDIERWERERRILILRRAAAVALLAAVIIAPQFLMTAMRGSLLVRPVVVMVGAVTLFWAYLLWTINPYRLITASGKPGDCTERTF